MKKNQLLMCQSIAVVIFMAGIAGAAYLTTCRPQKNPEKQYIIFRACMQDALIPNAEAINSCLNEAIKQSTECK